MTNKSVYVRLGVGVGRVVVFWLTLTHDLPEGMKDRKSSLQVIIVQFHNSLLLLH